MILNKNNKTDARQMIAQICSLQGRTFTRMTSNEDLVPNIFLTFFFFWEFLLDKNIEKNFLCTYWIEEWISSNCQKTCQKNTKTIFGRFEYLLFVDRFFMCLQFWISNSKKIRSFGIETWKLVLLNQEKRMIIERSNGKKRIRILNRVIDRYVNLFQIS